jgi:hypothetical protein
MRKIIPQFSLWFLVIFAVLSVSNKYFKQYLEQKRIEQEHLIAENVKDRFQKFLQLPFTTSLMGAQYFSQHNMKTDDYGLLESFIQTAPEIVGLNIVDADGLIIRGFPLALNSVAVGRKSQNTPYLKQVFQQYHSYWLSPPMTLFQEIKGFVFYVPIMREKKLRGWFATVMSAENFLKRFRLDVFVKDYHILVFDRESKTPFFTSGKTNPPSKHIQQLSVNIHGRLIDIFVWRKKLFFWEDLSIAMVALASALLALLITFIFYLYDEQKKSRVQLTDIRKILKLTSSEALSYVIDLSGQMKNTGERNEERMRQNLQYLVNLLEQVDLLQAAAQDQETLSEERVNLSKTIKDTVYELETVIQKRGLKVRFKEPENGESIYLRCNEWLFKYSVVYNLLSHVIVHADDGSMVDVNFQVDEDSSRITIHVERVNTTGGNELPIHLDRRLEVAKNLLQFYGALFHLHYDLNQGLILRITLPGGSQEA